jgi:hypothetical protein
MENIFGSIKEFIWDIIGYLIPGALVLVLLNIIFNIELKTDTGHFLFIIISYIIGYVIYGLNVFIYERSSRSCYRTIIEEMVKERPEYDISLKKVNEKLIKNFDKNTSIRVLRSIIMSYIPESDSKIYTFTFRSELANSCATVCLIFGLIGLICKFFSCILTNIIELNMNLSFNYVIFYIILLVSSYFLHFTRDKFYKMSISLPFSIFTSKTL